MVSAAMNRYGPNTRANRRVRDWMCGVMLMATSVEGTRCQDDDMPQHDRAANLSYGHLIAWRQQSSRDRSPQSFADRQTIAGIEVGCGDTVLACVAAANRCPSRLD
ncbi:hypothetical protein MAUB_53160 [Mycolicibacterium aubagnense]|uniref:Uncharacterized protein n=1 Tax=Mycolicibacterium aubagnense TaxID=319707 RepID=A0ABN5Z0A1_9MYCO|nr:hypothetical protein MAUB_53160 [Mycolicibacterium aubagnense]